MWLGLLVGALSVSASVEIRMQAPPCAWGALIPASLERLDTLSVSSTAAVAVSVVVEPEVLRLRLTKGARVLGQRQLPVDGACEARSDGVALVVEQQLRELGYVPMLPAAAAPPPGADPATADRAEDPPPAPRLDPPPPPVEPEEQTGVVTPPAPPPDPDLSRGDDAVGTQTATLAPAALHLWLQLGGLLQAPSALGVRGGGSAELGLGPGPWRAFVAVATVAPSQTTLTRAGSQVGTLSQWALHTSLGAELCLTRALGQVCGRGRVGLEAVRARSQGDLLFGEGGAWRLVPLFGAGARGVWRLSERFALWGAAEAIVRPRPATFVVEGAREAADPVISFLGSAGGSVRFF